MILYLGMGWFALYAWRELAWGLGNWGAFLLLAGGVAYTVGALLYGLGKKIKYIHSVFHIFTVIGSLLHYLSVFIYIL